VTPQILQPLATVPHQAPATNHGHLLTAEPVPSQTNIQNRLN
jgi:hypothetical protein